MPLICDTGPILASLDRADPDHEPCARLITSTTEDLIVPGLVLAELDYWCRKLRLPAGWRSFAEDVRSGAWRVVWPSDQDLARSQTLRDTHSDLDLGIVDASIIAVAERMKESKIATLDRRHFGAVSPTHVQAFTLLPG